MTRVFAGDSGMFETAGLKHRSANTACRLMCLYSLGLDHCHSTVAMALLCTFSCKPQIIHAQNLPIKILLAKRTLLIRLQNMRDPTRVHLPVSIIFLTWFWKQTTNVRQYVNLSLQGQVIIIIILIDNFYIALYIDISTSNPIPTQHMHTQQMTHRQTDRQRQRERERRVQNKSLSKTQRV